VIGFVESASSRRVLSGAAWGASVSGSKLLCRSGRKGGVGSEPRFTSHGSRPAMMAPTGRSTWIMDVRSFFVTRDLPLVIRDPRIVARAAIAPRFWFDLAGNVPTRDQSVQSPGGRDLPRQSGHRTRITRIVVRDVRFTLWGGASGGARRESSACAELANDRRRRWSVESAHLLLRRWAWREIRKGGASSDRNGSPYGVWVSTRPRGSGT